MKYLKIFEEYNDNIEEGDYVYLDSTDNLNHSKSLNDFLKNHIGVVEEIHNRIYVYFIFNDDDSEEIKNEFNHVISFNKKYILLHDKDLENLKIKIDSLKYNI